jgi:4'-phosphopantetheinyl transferase
MVLPEDAIHVWAFPTRTAETAGLERVLADDERMRADRFRFGHLRESFVIAHGVLRHLLGRYLGVRPSELRFTYGSKGKPAVISESGLEFNMSHSGRMALVAMTRRRPIGVDIEEIRPLSGMSKIAESFFGPEEASEIFSLPEAERELAFFSCWTRKEAYIKAIGEGLSAPLDRFRVSITANTPARMIHIEDDAAAAEMWCLEDLQVADNYSAALAYRGQRLSLSLFRIADPAALPGDPQ